ncbi:MAG: Na+/H+ antiporter subunit E [Acidobacteriota bacterium]
MIRTALLLGVIWVALTGDLSGANVAFGVLLGWLAVRVGRPLGPDPVFARVRPLKAVGLLLYLAWQILVANLKVVAAILGPRRRLRPALVAVPLDVTTDGQIAALANLISLTPGTLSLDVSPDRRSLYVHAMSASSPEALRREIKEGFERRVLEALP